LAQTLTTVQVTGGEVIDPTREAVYFINHVDFQFITTKKLATFENMRQQFFHKYLRALLGTISIQDLTSFVTQVGICSKGMI
jgi:hypothetical protein